MGHNIQSDGEASNSANANSNGSSINIAGVDAKLPKNMNARTEALAKVLSINNYEKDYKDYYNPYDLWVLFEALFRYPLAASFYAKNPFERYDQNIRSMITAMFPSTSIYKLKEGGLSVVEAQSELSRMKYVRLQIWALFKNRKNSPVTHYEDYETDDLRKVLTILIYLIRQRRNPMDDPLRTINNIGVAKDAGADKGIEKIANSTLNKKTASGVNNTLKTGNKLLARANVAVSVLSVGIELGVTDMQNHVAQICQVLFKKDDFDISESADKFCHDTSAYNASLSRLENEGEEYFEQNGGLRVTSP